MAAVFGTGAITATAGAATTSPQTAYHYAANGNFSSSGRYLPAADGFNTADVDSAAQLSEVPSGDHAMVYAGTCQGANSSFTSLVNSTSSSSKVLGYYLMDEPDAFTNGRYGTYCPPANLKAEADYVHSHAPGTLAWIIDMNDRSSSAPSFNPPGTTAYTPSSTHLDGVALDPYPCRTELNGCSTTMVGKYVSAAEAAGWSASQIYPVYQAFGNWCSGDDGGGNYALPTASQEQAIMQEWVNAGITNPRFDYTYSWGQQCGDRALNSAPATLQQVFTTHNTG